MIDEHSLMHFTSWLQTLGSCVKVQGSALEFEKRVWFWGKSTHKIWWVLEIFFWRRLEVVPPTCMYLVQLHAFVYCTIFVFLAHWKSMYSISTFSIYLKSKGIASFVTRLKSLQTKYYRNQQNLHKSNYNLSSLRFYELKRLINIMIKYISWYIIVLYTHTGWIHYNIIRLHVIVWKFWQVILYNAICFLPDEDST